MDSFNHDTIGMVVVDEKGDVSAGTSTNGASHKVLFFKPLNFCLLYFKNANAYFEILNSISNLQVMR